MKKLLAFASKPLHFAILVGVMMATLTYTVGSKAIKPTKKLLDQEMVVLSQKVAHAYVASHQARADLKKSALGKALREVQLHPSIISVTVRSQANQIVGSVQKNVAAPYRKFDELTYPILGAEGELIGKVEFELNDQSQQSLSALRSKMRWTSFFGFLLGFFICFVLLRGPPSLIPSILSVVKQIGKGNLEVTIPVLDHPEYAGLTDGLRKMVDGLHERDRMRHSLGRIMDPKIADALIKEDPKLGGRRRQATILFCDIRNYTSICEELNVDELQEFLNGYWKGTVEIIMEQDGTIDKFHGDGICVVFGAPTLHDDDPLRAVRTAWNLIKNVEKLNEKREQQRKMPIEIGIGIHSGEVIAGHIGSERRMDYTVVGDVVNVASRIEELNKKFGSHILISDSVYESVEPYVRVKTLALAHLRGHKRPILIHALKEFFDEKSNSQQNRAA